MKEYLDIEWLEKMTVTSDEKKVIVKRLLVLDYVAEKMVIEKRLSKTMHNRISNLWLYLPSTESQSYMKNKFPEAYNHFFKKDSLDISKLKIALYKLKVALNESSSFAGVKK